MAVMEEKIKVGDVVQLKQGGQIMTVTQINKKMGDDFESAFCSWPLNGVAHHGAFALAALKRASKGSIRAFRIQGFLAGIFPFMNRGKSS